MNLRKKASILLSCVLVMAALAVGADNGKPVTVKGYVLDSACAFTKSLKKPISPPVTANGKVFQRGGSSALVIEKIEAQPAQQ